MTFSANSVRILLVEDDPEMGELLTRGLSAEGYDALLVTNGVDALIEMKAKTPALAVIDVMLPAMTGFELCRRIRTSGGDMPLLILTARDSVEDRVFGLDSGADDYLTKPFAFAELNARIRALLRRDSPAGKLTVEVGSLRLDSLTSRAFVGTARLQLSPKEFALLRLLAVNVGRVVTRTRILDGVWGSVLNIDQNIVDQYVSYLRRKLSGLDAGVTLVTERGQGYRLEAS